MGEAENKFAKAVLLNSLEGLVITTCLHCISFTALIHSFFHCPIHPAHGVFLGHWAKDLSWLSAPNPPLDYANIEIPPGR